MRRTGIDACIGKHHSSAASFTMESWRELEGEPTRPPRMWGRQQVQSSAGGQASTAWRTFPSPLSTQSLLASPQIAHQRGWGFWQPAAVFSGAFALPTTSFEDLIMGHLIHLNECSGSFGAWGYACMLQTVVIVTVMETLHDLSSPIVVYVLPIG